jgi:hypothetical protein
VTRGGGWTAALLVTVGTPATWPLALATFLVRGGVILILLPIVVLPTTVGLGNVFGPTLTSVAFGSVPVQVIVAAGAVGVVALAWLVVGGWLAAALEAEGARIVARDEEIVAFAAAGISPETAVMMSSGSVAARILVARLIACVPLALVVALGSIRLVFVTYRELTSPIDVSTPITLRVLRGSPEVVVAVIVAWTFAEIVGAVAARRIALGHAGVGEALTGALSVLVRKPLSSLARFVIPTMVLLVILVPAAVAASSTWEAVGSVLGDPGEPVALLLTVVAFVGLWAVGLVVVAVVCAWRAAIWTVAEVGRKGTFGGSTDRRPGHWRLALSSATLWLGRSLGRSRRRGEP